MMASSEPLLDSDDESRRIKNWLREDEKIEFDFDPADDDEKDRRKIRPKSGRMTADDLRHV